MGYGGSSYHGGGSYHPAPQKSFSEMTLEEQKQYLAQQERIKQYEKKQKRKKIFIVVLIIIVIGAIIGGIVACVNSPAFQEGVKQGQELADKIIGN